VNDYDVIAACSNQSTQRPYCHYYTTTTTATTAAAAAREKDDDDDVIVSRCCQLTVVVFVETQLQLSDSGVPKGG